ncbi:MAG: type IV pilus assembly protein PilM, partial [Nitrospirae bacterium]|nr:type IV pilus assembly protein PilM [Nitrospirota bacterium]
MKLNDITMRFRRFPIGIDIGTASIKVVQLAYGSGGIVLRYAGLTELIRHDDESGDRGAVIALSDILRQGSLNKKKIAINFSGKNTLIRYLTIPKMPKEEISEAIKWESKKITPIPVEDLVIDYLIVGETEERDIKRYEIVLVAVEREAVMDQISSLKKAGLKAAAIDVNPLSVLNAIRLNYADDLADNIVFVDIGAGKTEINISKKGILRFTRSVQIGGGDITAALSRELQLDYADAERMKKEFGMIDGSSGTPDRPDNRVKDIIKNEADRLILEVQRSIDYYRAQFREGSIKKIILMGGTPIMPGFKD